ncbi:MAG: YceI family protein [Chitinophagaceae bacterium]
MSNETKWSIDPSHSEISFKVRHLMIAQVRGSFKTFDASIYVTDKNFATAEIDLWIDASSVTTGNESRDEHLKGAEFFDIINHKQIGFTSSTIEKADEDGNHTLWGELTIKGITKNVKLNVVFGGIMNDPWSNEKAGFSVTGTINRNDWGLAWNTVLETGAIMVSDEIKISCEIELTNNGSKDLSMQLNPVIEESIVF